MDMPLALLLIDVDDLKVVNDTGATPAATGCSRPGTGDGVVLRKTDRAFRGRRRVRDPPAGLGRRDRARRRAADPRVGGQRRRPDGADRAVLRLDRRVGYPIPSIASHDLYRNADAALYSCKRHGRTAVVAFDPSSTASPRRPLGRRAVGGRQPGPRTRALRPVYQPIFSMTTGRAIGYEGLVRPDRRGPATPARCSARRREPTGRRARPGLPGDRRRRRPLPDSDAYLSVNLAADARVQPVPGRRAQGDLPGAGHPARPDRARADGAGAGRGSRPAPDERRGCRRAGLRLAADDVGAGNAGLRLLSEVHFDIVKIDLSLVQGGVMQDPRTPFARCRSSRRSGRRRSSPRASRPPSSCP